MIDGEKANSDIRLVFFLTSRSFQRIGQTYFEDFVEFRTNPSHPCSLSAQSPSRTKRTQPRGIRKMQEVSGG